MPKVKKKKNSNHIKKQQNNKEGIFNFNEQVEPKTTKKTKTATRKKKKKEVQANEDFYIETKEVPPVNKKKNKNTSIILQLYMEYKKKKE